MEQKKEFIIRDHKPQQCNDNNNNNNWLAMCTNRQPGFSKDNPFRLDKLVWLERADGLHWPVLTKEMQRKDVPEEAIAAFDPIESSYWHRHNCSGDSVVEVGHVLMGDDEEWPLVPIVEHKVTRNAWDQVIMTRVCNIGREVDQHTGAVSLAHMRNQKAFDYVVAVCAHGCVGYRGKREEVAARLLHLERISNKKGEIYKRGRWRGVERRCWPCRQYTESNKVPFTMWCCKQCKMPLCSRHRNKTGNLSRSVSCVQEHLSANCAVVGCHPTHPHNRRKRFPKHLLKFEKV